MRRPLRQKKEHAQSHAAIDAVNAPAVIVHPALMNASVAVAARSAVTIASPAAATANVKEESQDLDVNPERAVDASVGPAMKGVGTATDTGAVGVEAEVAMKDARGAVIQRIRLVGIRRGEDRIVFRDGK
jgi:hypothetical protein